MTVKTNRELIAQAWAEIQALRKAAIAAKREAQKAENIRLAEEASGLPTKERRKASCLRKREEKLARRAAKA